MEGLRLLVSDPVEYCQSVQMAKVGLETCEDSPANSSTSAIPPMPVAQNPAHASETDPLTAFMSSLTSEQKAKLAALLLGGKPPD